jgi:hypothetical protein
MHWADEHTVSEAIEGWTDAQLACRSNGQHAWPTWKGTLVSHRPGVYTLRQRCTRNCGCWRQGDMNEQGYMVTTWKPVYPKNGTYLLPKGTGRIGQDGKAMMRLHGITLATVVEVTDEE